jgi:hypothetical protein
LGIVVAVGLVGLVVGEKMVRDGREKEKRGYLFGVEKGFLERERDAEKTVDWITVYGSK